MNKLKECRKKHNYSCQDMANMLNMSKSFYWQIENDKRRLSYKTALKVAKIFGMKPDDIFYEEICDKFFIYNLVHQILCLKNFTFNGLYDIIYMVIV